MAIRRWGGFLFLDYPTADRSLRCRLCVWLGTERRALLGEEVEKGLFFRGFSPFYLPKSRWGRWGCEGEPHADRRTLSSSRWATVSNGCASDAMVSPSCAISASCMR